MHNGAYGKEGPIKGYFLEMPDGSGYGFGSNDYGITLSDADGKGTPPIAKPSEATYQYGSGDPAPGWLTLEWTFHPD